LAAALLLVKPLEQSQTSPAAAFAGVGICAAMYSWTASIGRFAFCTVRTAPVLLY